MRHYRYINGAISRAEVLTVLNDGRLHFVFFELKACVLDDHAQSFYNFVHQVLSGRDVQHEFIPLYAKGPRDGL